MARGMSPSGLELSACRCPQQPSSGTKIPTMYPAKPPTPPRAPTSARAGDKHSSNGAWPEAWRDDKHRCQGTGHRQSAKIDHPRTTDLGRPTLAPPLARCPRRRGSSPCRYSAKRSATTRARKRLGRGFAGRAAASWHLNAPRVLHRNRACASRMATRVGVLCSGQRATDDFARIA